jgi:hypothetical protein
MQRGALISGIVGLTFATVALALELAYIRTNVNPLDEQKLLLNAILRTAEWVLIPLYWAWFLPFIFTFIMTLVGSFAIRAGCHCEDRSRCRRAAWTAHLTVVLPTLLVMVLNPTFWRVIVDALLKFLPHDLLNHTLHTPITVPTAWYLFPPEVAALARQSPIIFAKTLLTRSNRKPPLRTNAF